MPELYDAIGRGYRTHRRPDPRLGAAVARALGEARTVVNVGAGAGSYEPADRAVLAVEPAAAMIAQRPPGSAPVVQASATDLPLRDGACDAAMAVLTIHHWPDRARGLSELRRIARRRVVLLTWDPMSTPFWLEEYVPQVWMLDRPIFPTMDELRRELGSIEVQPLPVPHDCVDGFMGAYWRRPASYLDPDVRGAMSTFSKIADAGTGLARLRRDLDDGSWRRRHRALLELTELDLGYRLVIHDR
ncbi:MAG TPA: class I SAM-dependent methyltransferase [Methylomirabilota bacterium]|nr:class I SAM-dependent methyltransferase [Methylomirabilota bacterium]